MLTNKYYRKLAEPYLYKNIQVCSPNILSIPRLLLTLISRRERSKHIRSFALVTADEEIARDAMNLSNEVLDIEVSHHLIEIVRQKLFRKSSIIEELIGKLVYPFRDPHFELNWYLGVLNAARSVDGSLALVICLATNLEHLRLMNLSPEITEAVCRVRWERSIKGASSRVYPLHKLKSLNVVLGKKASIPILTPVEALKVSGEGDIHNFQWPRNGSEAVGTLRSLELRHINLRSNHLHRMLALPAMHGIHHLKMRDVCVLGYDYNHLGELLRVFLPSLKTFEWTGVGESWPPRRVRPFGSFEGFTQLEDLTINLEYIATYGHSIYDPPAPLLQPKQFFPDSLRALTIQNFPQTLLYDLHETCVDSPSENYLLTTAASLGLSAFDLFVIPAEHNHTWLYYKEPDGEFLQELLSGLRDVGTSMRIYFKVYGCDSLVYDSGCAAVGQ